MAVLLDQDDAPLAPDDEAQEDDGKVECPECGQRYKTGGIKRHLTVAHGADPATKTTGKRHSGIIIQETGAEFQRTASILVALACKDCGRALYEDADKDWRAIDRYCENRPSLRKQVIKALQWSDFVLLMGAFMSTAQKMMAHHSIGEKFSFAGAPSSNGDHATHDPMANMAAFLQAIPEDERNRMINEALTQYQNVNAA